MSAAALDRQIRPIYDALDTGSNKSAIVSCNKLLKKHPKNELIKALKALALVRSQKVEEALPLCDEILELKPTDDAVLTAMMHSLRALGRRNDTVTMFEDAFKKQPGNQDLGAQTFFANVRANNWKAAHQIATRMNKQFQEDRYLYWSICCAVLQANDPATPLTMRTILFKLAHRLLTSSPTPSYVHAERFHLHLSILRELELYDDAAKLLDSDVGKTICSINLSCNEVRRDIWRRQQLLRQESERAEQLIIDKKDRNWLEFLAVLDGAVPLSFSSGNMPISPETILHAQNIFSKVAKEDGLTDRSGPLALLELEKRARIHGVSEDPDGLFTQINSYFESFGDKACCFEDLKPYLDINDKDLLNVFSAHNNVPRAFTTVFELHQLINCHKILRYTLTDSEITIEKESDRIALYTRYYFDALPLGDGLHSTELQPADDLAILAGNAFVNLWKLSGHESHLVNAVYLLEFALTKSKHSFLIRIILIRLYRLLGAPASALEHYRIIQVKQIQHDTLSHLILSRASTFSLASTGDLTLASECLEATQIYLSNTQETGDFVVRAFTAEKYSQIPEFIVFEERLENSLQRDIMKIEHLRMRLTHEPITSDIIDMELIELKFIFDKDRYDNRDFTILPNYQPFRSQNLDEQTLLFGKIEGPAWLSVFLKVYIRALQQASDLDDTVEEKLLIGDRPKRIPNSEKKPSFRERLLQQKDDLSDLTPLETTFVEYVNALVDWLEPYHNHARPPPSVVLAEAAKQTELKTGHPLKGVEIPATNGANGHHRKDEEPPVVHEPPELVVKYFETMKSCFQTAASNSSPSELLHASTLMQEAFLIFVSVTLRFKSPSIVKINKLGALVATFKELRSNSISILKEVSSELIKRGERDGSSDARNTYVNNRSPFLAPQIDHDFAFTCAKKLTDSRRKVLEGVGKGIARLCTMYSS